MRVDDRGEYRSESPDDVVAGNPSVLVSFAALLHSTPLLVLNVVHIEGGKGESTWML